MDQLENGCRQGTRELFSPEEKPYPKAGHPGPRGGKSCPFEGLEGEKNAYRLRLMSATATTSSKSIGDMNIFFISGSSIAKPIRCQPEGKKSVGTAAQECPKTRHRA